MYTSKVCPGFNKNSHNNLNVFAAFKGIIRQIANIKLVSTYFECYTSQLKLAIC